MDNLNIIQSNEDKSVYNVTFSIEKIETYDMFVILNEKFVKNESIKITVKKNKNVENLEALRKK